MREVTITELPAMKVASFHGYGESPEMIAYGEMTRWLAAAGVVSGKPPSRVFGFNNPDPEPGTTSYGYEFWVELPPGSELGRHADETAAVTKQFPGGRYVSLRHEGPGEGIGAAWKELVRQAGERGLDHGDHQWLEEHHIDLGNESEVLCLDCLGPIR